MKKYKALIICIILIMSATTTFILANANARIVLNGVELEFEALPIIRNNRTMVPMRTIFEYLGAEVLWDENSRTISAQKDETSILLQIDKKTAYLNSKEIILDSPPIIENGRTLVPLRFVSESLDSKVEWNAFLRTVYIETSGEISDDRDFETDDDPFLTSSETTSITTYTTENTPEAPKSSNTSSQAATNAVVSSEIPTASSSTPEYSNAFPTSSKTPASTEIATSSNTTEYSKAFPTSSKAPASSKTPLANDSYIISNAPPNLQKTKVNETKTNNTTTVIKPAVPDTFSTTKIPTTSNAPKTTAQTPATSNAPKTTTQTPTTSNAPKTMTQAPTTSNTPKTTVQTPTTSNAPKTTTQAPTTSNAPKTTTQTPTTSYVPETTTTAASEVPSAISNTPGRGDAQTSQAETPKGDYVSLAGNTISVGDSLSKVISDFGTPSRIDPSNGYDWYVYNSDYTKFIMIGIKDGEVVAIYTNAKGFEANGIRHGSTSGENTPDIRVYIDKLDGNKVHAIMINTMPVQEVFDQKFVEASELQLIDMLNVFRINKGLNALSVDSIAAKTAREHCQDMALREFFDHKNPDGLLPWDRYNNNNGTHFACCENIAAGQRSPFEAHDSWLNSQGHRDNMEYEPAKYIGTGVSYKANTFYSLYYTQLFSY